MYIHVQTTRKRDCIATSGLERVAQKILEIDCTQLDGAIVLNASFTNQADLDILKSLGVGQS